MIKKDISYYSGDRKEILEYVPENAKKLIDIGCGQGLFAKQLKNESTEIWGIEPNKKAGQLASQIIDNVLIGKVEEFYDKLPDNYFDAIFLNDVLEHFENPWSILKNLKKKLSSNGTLILSVPNFRYIVNLVEIFMKKDFKYVESGIMDSTHLRFFTKKSLIRILRICGYQIVSIKGSVKTSSIIGKILSYSLLLFSFGYYNDIFHKRYIVKAIDKKDSSVKIK